MIISSSDVASSSSTPAPLPLSVFPLRRYDVFISFRGPDTRDNFTSHLHYALCKKGISTFVDDKLSRGDPISTLFSIIQNSKLSVIILSKSYASSKWCLEELVKILECKETHGQMVIPVFYNVDPSDVRNQTGRYAKSFAKHDGKQSPGKIQKWRHALREASNLAGLNTAATRPDALLVEKIVKDIWDKVKRVYPDDDKSLVGMPSKITEMVSLLNGGSKDFCVLGIWGIGKTTLATAAFNKIPTKFEGAYFIKNIGSESKKDRQLLGYRQQLSSAILGEENMKLGFPNIGLPYFETRFNEKKLLIVFDNVTEAKQIESLVGPLDNWFNTGSRFIVTARDKQVLRHCCSDENIYELDGLAGTEALQLFTLHAFKKEFPLTEYRELSEKIVTYTYGVPLALEVLGASLFDKGKQVWESTLKKLERSLDKTTQSILKISYDGLDEHQKRIFLDIACFFNGYTTYFLVKFFDGCDFATKTEFDVLIDKCLINEDREVIIMHELLEKMGKEIIRQQQDDPGKRTRLWHHKDVFQVLKQNMGTEAIEGISLDMDMVDGIYLQKNTFEKMKKLRILEFHSSKFKVGNANKVHVPKGLDCDLNELRYFKWHGCPLKSLEPNFNPKYLVELDIYGSNVEQLWEGVQCLFNLRRLSLDWCQKLTAIPNLSKAENLEHLSFQGCSSLTNLPSLGHLKLNADHFRITNCSNLEFIQELPPNTKYLAVEKIAIEELPSSIANLSRLTELEISDCQELRCLPDNICTYGSLESLTIYNCPKLERMPRDLEGLRALRNLTVSGTAIEELPLSILDLPRLTELKISDCPNLKSFPGDIPTTRKLMVRDFLLPVLDNNSKRFPEDSWQCLKWKKGKKGNFSPLRNLIVSRTGIEELPDFLRNLRSLVKLDLSDCSIPEIEWFFLPSFMPFPLEHLNLSRTKVGIFLNIEDLPNLVELNLSCCDMLQSLPKLPVNLRILRADGCTSLKTLSCSSIPKLTNFIGCYNLDWNLPIKILEGLGREVMKGKWLEDFEQLNKKCTGEVNIVYPGQKIPKWFGSQSAGSFVTLELQTGLLENIVGFAVCVVVNLPCDHDIGFDCKVEYRNSHSQVQKSCISGKLYSSSFDCLPMGKYGGYHLIVGYLEYNLSLSQILSAEFEFYVNKGESPGEKRKCYEMEACGVHLFYDRHSRKHVRSSLFNDKEPVQNIKRVRLG